MTNSMVGPEKMEDWLFRHGLKNPQDLREGMRVIEQYVTFRVRQRYPELFEDDVPVVFVKTAPNAKRRTWRGDPDRMIECSECGLSKQAEGNYYRRRDTSTGWGLKCKICISPNSTKENPDGVPGVPEEPSREVPRSEAPEGQDPP